MVEKHVLTEQQRAAVDRMLAEPTHAALIASDMGKGKTTLASQFLVELGAKRVIVVGIRDTFHQWAERLAAQSDGQITLRRIDATKVGKQAFEDMIAGEDGFWFSGSQYLTAKDWTHEPVLNPDGSQAYVIDKMTGLPTDKKLTERKHLRTYARMKQMDAIIFDEVHTLQNRKAVGRRTITTLKTDWKVGMSGTFAGNSIEGAWSITRWLWPSVIAGSFYAWRDEYCETETVYLQGGRTTSKVSAEKTPGRFVSEIPCYIRDEADEAAPESLTVFVDLTTKQREQYSALEADMLVWLESRNGFQPLVADLPITLRSRLRTATLGEMSFNDDGEIHFDMGCESSKLRALRGILDTWGEQPALILTDSKKFAKVTVARMRQAGYGVAEWSGDTSSKDRDEIKRQFMEMDPGVRYIVGVIPALAAGIDGLQRVSNKIVWLSESENQILNAQALARLFRPGRTLDNGGFCSVKILARNTYDEGIFSRLIQNHLGMQASMRAA